MPYEVISAADIACLVIYFVVIITVGLIATCRAKRGSADGFFLAGKSMTFIPIAGSIFASNIGATAFVALAGSAAANGFAPVMYEWHAIYILILLGWIFVPIYIASGSFTMPEYIKKRYGGQRLRIFYAIVQLVLIFLTGIASELYAGALFINRILNWDLYLCTILILAVTAVYTIGGGLSAVIYTDALQTVIVVVGGFILSGLALNSVGGYYSMLDRYMDAISNTTNYTHTMYGNLTCGFPPVGAFHVFREADSDLPWPGIVFGLTIISTYFWCTNQVIVQRNLSAKNMSHSKAACVVASYLKFFPFILFVWPGMISRILYPDEVACSDPDVCMEICSNRHGCTNIAYPLLVLRILPDGLRGIMLAALLSALMSSLTSQFNSSSSIFTMDIWTFLRPSAKGKELVVVGRVFGLILVGLSIGWLPVLQAMQGSQLWDYMQATCSYITPPWVVIFVMGMFWKRTTEKGAFWGVIAGLAAGVVRLGVQFSYPTPVCGEDKPDTRPGILTKVHYLYVAVILAVVTFIVTALVTLFTTPRRPQQLRKLTWWTRHNELEPELSDNEDDSELERNWNEEEDAYVPPSQLSRARNCYNWACGFNTEPSMVLTKERRAEIWRRWTAIDENRFWKYIYDSQAIIVLMIACFVIGVYA